MSSPMQQVPLLPQAGSIIVSPPSGQVAPRGGSTTTARSNSPTDSEVAEIFGIAEDPAPTTVYVLSRGNGGDSSDSDFDDIDDLEDDTLETDTARVGASRDSGRAPGLGEAGLASAKRLDIRDPFLIPKRKSAVASNGEPTVADEEAEGFSLKGTQTAGVVAAFVPTTSFQTVNSNTLADKRPLPAKRSSQPDSQASLQDWYDWWVQALAEKHRDEEQGNAPTEPYPGFTKAWNKLLESATHFFASIFANP